MTNYHADSWDRLWGVDFNETLGNTSWASIKDWGNVSVNFNNSRGVSAQITDVSDVWIDTDTGNSWFKVEDAYDVRFNLDQYGNSNNSVQVYDADDISFYATGGSNWMKFQDVDDVDVWTDWGANSVNIYDADDVGTLHLGGSGDNWVDIKDVDTVNAEIWGGGNTVRIDMQQDFWDGDYTRENSVNLNFQGGRGYDDVEVRDADDVWIDTDAGNGRFYVKNSDDVRVQMDQYGNSNNKIEVYDSLDVSVYATGSGNTLYAGHNDNVEVDFSWGENHVDIWYADDVRVNFGGDGGNYLKVWDADSVDATIHDGYNRVDINMNQKTFEGDDFSEESVRLNFNGAEGGNDIRIVDSDYTWIDIDAGGNTLTLDDTDAIDLNIYGGDNKIVINDADDVRLELGDKAKSFHNDVTVTDADDVRINTSEGANTFRLEDIDDVSITTAGWYNTFDIDDADDVSLTVRGQSRYQDVNIDDAFDVSLNMSNLEDSRIWVEDADDVYIDGTGENTDRQGNNIVQLGWGDDSVEDATVKLSGADNTIQIDSDVGGLEGNDITVVSGARSKIDVDTSGGGTSDIAITAGDDSSINVDAGFSFDTSVQIHSGDGGTAKVDADGANIDIDIYGSSRDKVSTYGAYASVYTYGGDDEIDVYSLGADVDSGDGDDTVTVGAVGASVRLGAGNDTAWVGAVGVHLDAGSGDDIINLTATGANVLGGSGNDTIHVLAAGANIVAGSGNDVVYAANFGARIDTGDGNDTIHAAAAGSYIDSGAGNDTLYLVGLASGVSTGAGDDQVYSAAAGQFIHAGGGDNVVIGLGGANVVVAEEGDDLVMAAGGANVLATGAGDDDILAVGHANVAITDAGDDSVFMIGGILSTPAALLSPNLNGLGAMFNTAGGLAQLLGANLAVTGAGDDFITNLNLGLKGSVLSPEKSWADKSTFQKSMYVLDLPFSGGETSIPSMNISLAGDGDDVVLTVGEMNIVSGGQGDDTIVAVGANNIILGDQFDLDALSEFAKNALGNLFSGDGVDLSKDLGRYAGTYDDFDERRAEAEAAGVEYTRGDLEIRDDTIVTVGKSSTVLGMQGDDQIVAVGVQNNLGGGSGADLVVGIGAKNIINGDYGNDVLVGFGAANWMMGGAGDDTVISAGLGSIVSTDFSGGIGSAAVKTLASLVGDTVTGVATAAQDLYTELFTDRSADGGYLQKLDELVNTSKDAGNDTVVATGGASLIFTGHGNDNVYTGGLGSFVYAGDGDDFLVNMAGGAVLLGGEGDDVFVNLGGTASSDGGAGNDFFLEIGYGIFTEFSDYLTYAFETFDGAIGTFLDAFNDTITDTISGLGDEISEMFAGIDSKLQDTFLDPDGDLANAGKAVEGSFDDAGTYITDAFNDLLKEFSTGLFEGLLPKDEEFDALVEGFDVEDFGGFFGSAGGAETRGGDGDDIFVTGFGVDSISGGGGSDTYVFYQGEGMDIITDTGETGTDTILFNINQFGAEPPLDLGDILFTVDEGFLFGDDNFTISTGREGSTSNILINDMFDGEDFAVESLKIDFGDQTIEFDLTEIFQRVAETEDKSASLADLLQADSNATFEALASALEDAVVASDGSAESIANAAPVDVAFIQSVQDDQTDDIFNVQGNA